jgi:hypothetical protein
MEMILGPLREMPLCFHQLWIVSPNVSPRAGR